MRAFFAFFLISGLCSLVYQVVWLRLAMAAFGVTTPLVSIVLSVFMAGLGLGSLLAGRLAGRLEHAPPATALRLYALAELAIALSGGVVPRLLSWGQRVVTGGDSAWGSLGHYLAAGGWIGATLLPFCTCMGATIPLAMAAIRGSHPASSRHSFSYLYVANLVGAALGTLTSAFVLIEVFGFRGTLQLTATLNALLAALALLVSMRLRPHGTPARAPAGGESLPPLTIGREALFLTMLFLTGLASMALEVVWVRQFTAYLGTVVYAFAMILTIYLLANLAGSTLYRRWLRRGAPGENALAAAWLLLGLLALVPLLAADPRIPWPAGLLDGSLRLIVAIAPFSAATGFVTPLLVDRFSSGAPGRAGSAYAVNVLGCILGPLLAGFWWLPALGERGTSFVVALCLAGPALAAGLGLRAIRLDGPAWRQRVALGGVALAAALLLVLTRDYETRFPKRQVRRDYTATVVATGEGFDRRLIVNGIGMTELTPVTKMMAHLPMAAQGGPPRDALAVCMGMGTTLRSLLSWGTRATAVELVPSVPAMFAYYHPDAPELLASGRGRIVVDDGRRFLERSPAVYDVITIDPPPPVEAAGSSLLYSREFYGAARRRLRPGGILQQWVPYGDAATLASLTRALTDSFPHVRVFGSLEGWGFHFLARQEPFPPLVAVALAERLPSAARRDLEEWTPGVGAERLFALVLGREVPAERLIAMAPHAPSLSDDRPVNEYFFLRRVLATRGSDAPR